MARQPRKKFDINDMAKKNILPPADIPQAPKPQIGPKNPDPQITAAKPKPKPTPKPKPKKSNRTVHVQTTLTKEESQMFNDALDGRTAARVLRKMILNYIQENK